MALSDAEKKMFDDFVDIVNMQRVALVESHRKVGDKIDRALIICLIEREGEEFHVTPLVEFITNKMFKSYIDPATTGESGDPIGDTYKPQTKQEKIAEAVSHTLTSVSQLGEEEQRVLQLAGLSDSIAVFVAEERKRLKLDFGPGELAVSLMLGALSVARSAEMKKGASLLDAAKLANENSDLFWTTAKEISELLAEWITISGVKAPSH